MLDGDGINSCINNPDTTKCPTGKCTILTIYYNNNNNHNFKNNVDNNFKGNDHFPFQADYNSALTTTWSKPNFDTTTKRNAKDHAPQNKVLWYNAYFWLSNPQNNA